MRSLIFWFCLSLTHSCILLGMELVDLPTKEEPVRTQWSKKKAAQIEKRADRILMDIYSQKEYITERLGHKFREGEEPYYEFLKASSKKTVTIAIMERVVDKHQSEDNHQHKDLALRVMETEPNAHKTPKSNQKNIFGRMGSLFSCVSGGVSNKPKKGIYILAVTFIDKEPTISTFDQDELRQALGLTLQTGTPRPGNEH